MSQLKLSKRNLINLVLAVVVITLVLVVIYKPGKEETSTKIIQIDTSPVTSIKIERVGTQATSFLLEDKDWHMVEPYAMKANKIKVESLLDLLQYNYHARYDIADLDVKKYGLDIPRTTITFNEEHKFEFGSTEPLNKYRYIRYKDTLYLTDDFYYHRILGAATSFLDHALIDKKHKITKIELPGLTLTLKDAKWEAKPKPKQYSNDQANELVDHWMLSHAIEINSYPPVRGTGQVRVHVEGRKTPIHFDIFTFNDEFFLGRKDLNITYKLAAEKRRDLLQLPPAINAK